MAASKLPPHALRLSTYAELEAYVRAFAAGHLHLLMLFGPPGVGKSRHVRQALDQRVGWIGGQATPLGIYLEAYAYRNQPLVLDDVDGPVGAIRDPAGNARGLGVATGGVPEEDSLDHAPHDHPSSDHHAVSVRAPTMGMWRPWSSR